MVKVSTKTKKAEKSKKMEQQEVINANQSPDVEKMDVLLKPSEVPVTLAHFEEIKRVNSSEHTTINLTIKSLERKIDANFKAAESKNEARFIVVENSIKALETKFETKFEARFVTIENNAKSLEAKMDLGFAKMHEMYHKLLLVVEEQNSKNNFMFDHLNMLYDRLTKHEIETKDNFKNVHYLLELNNK